MDTQDIVISLDQAFDCYEYTKRIISDEPLYCYLIPERKFVKIKEKYKDISVLFPNAYRLCLELIDEYLSQPPIDQFREAYKKEAKTQRNKVVCFLWFFEHLDGCVDFQRFEIPKMTKILKKWCKHNGFAYTEPQVYRITDDRPDHFDLCYRNKG